jgi:hypothetical protein
LVFTYYCSLKYPLQNATFVESKMRLGAEQDVSVFSANTSFKFSQLLDRSQNPIRCGSDSTPTVKLLKLETQEMFNPKVLVNATFATVAVLSLGFTSHAASAKSIFVTHGSHGAISIVDEVPVGATALPTTPSQGYPNLITRGPGGASSIVNDVKEMKSMVKTHPSPKLMTFGSHGASQIVE